MSKLRTSPLVTLALVGGAVVFGMVLAGGLDWTPASLAAPVAAPAALTTGATSISLRGLPSFADLADAVLPAVVTIDATTIEKADGRRRESREGVNPFEFFLGPQRGPRGPQGQPAPRQPEPHPRPIGSTSSMRPTGPACSTGRS